MARKKRIVKETAVVVKNVTKKRKVKRKTRKQRKGMDQKALRRQQLAKLTPTGLDFLKSSISSRDFPGTRIEGVPDQYGGPSFVIKHRGVFTFTIDADLALTILLAPVPGMAYFAASAAATTGTTLVGNVFPDFTSIFGADISTGDFGTTNVAKFRIVSHSMEIKPISATLNNAGLITAARMPGLQIVENVAATGNTVSRAIVGTSKLTSANLSTLPGAYFGHVNEGMYGWAVNQDGTWPVSDIWYDTVKIPTSTSGDLGGLGMPAGSKAGIMGWGSMMPVGITLTGSNTNTSIAMEVEQIVEYFPVHGSLMSELASPSPPWDPLALMEYEKAASTLPAFVPASQNEGFWDRFLKAIGAATGFLSAIPGPLGMVFGGVSGVASGIRSLIQ